MTAFDRQKKNGHASAMIGPDGRRPLIQLRSVTKVYTSAAGELAVLKGISTTFYAGEFVGIIGKSGSGKSTLLNMITGIDRPTTGEVQVGGTLVQQLSESDMAVWRGRNIGIVFQFFQLLPMLSIVENIMLPMDFCNMYTPRQRRERAMYLLGLVDMVDQAHKLPSAISGGQQQRLAIARALANDPPIIVADEPTGNLDSTTAASVFDLFHNLVGEGKTVVMVTHDTSQAQRVTRTVLLADGEIVNEYVARALPLLTPEQMLQATRHLQPMTVAPGAEIIRQGAAGDRFYIITRGRVEVALRRPDAEDLIVSHMGEGQYFGEIELLRGGRNIATVRAVGESPVELVALDRETFVHLLDQSEQTRAAVNQIATSRMAENVAAGGETSR